LHRKGLIWGQIQQSGPKKKKKPKKGGDVATCQRLWGSEKNMPIDDKREIRRKRKRGGGISFYS